MANRTDPLISQVSGTDPQNLMEYLKRQRIYDSRYWKETCFGLTVENVLEESTHISKTRGAVAIGHWNFLALTLKLLQLHPETELIVESFCQQSKFKYTRALGALYVRLTGRPADIYTCLEALYQDCRKLRLYVSSSSTNAWSNNHYYMDDYVHALLTESHVAGIALPRLPQRRALQDAGYLPQGPRPTSLQQALEQHGSPLEYLKYKALVENSPAARKVWNDKYAARFPEKANTNNERDQGNKNKNNKKNNKKMAKIVGGTTTMGNKLFTKKKPSANPLMNETLNAKPQGSEEYWNEQRVKLGLAPLQK